MTGILAPVPACQAHSSCPINIQYINAPWKLFLWSPILVPWYQSISCPRRKDHFLLIFSFIYILAHSTENLGQGPLSKSVLSSYATAERTLHRTMLFFPDVIVTVQFARRKRNTEHVIRDVFLTVYVWVCVCACTHRHVNTYVPCRQFSVCAGLLLYC